MIDRIELLLSTPWFPRKESDEVLDNTLVITPFTTDAFNYRNFQLKITPLGNVSVFPVFSLDGKDLPAEELAPRFLDGSLGLYTPQRAEGDQILIEITENLNTPEQIHKRAILQFKKGEWQFLNFQKPLVIQPKE